MTKEYEVALVLDPTLTPEEETGLIEGVKANIEKLKGKITDTDERGRQKLAYPIKNHKEGIYCYYQLQIPPDQINQLGKLIRLNEKIIRHLVLSLDKQQIKAKRLQKIFKKSRQPENKSSKEE